MKALSEIIPWPIRWLIGLGTIVSLVWGTIETRFDSKVHASEQRVMEKVESYRKEDMAIIRSIKSNTDLLLEHALLSQKKKAK